MSLWGVLIWKTKSDDQPCMYIPRNLPYDVLNCRVNNRRGISRHIPFEALGVLVAQPRRIVWWRGAVNAITVGRKTPSFPGYWFPVKGLRTTGASVSAKYGYLLTHRTSIFSSRMSSQSASCNACDLPSFQTFVNAHTRFFDSATGTMEILPTVVQSECFTRTYECLSPGKLRKTFGSGIWWGLKIPCVALSGPRNFPVLQSSILATPSSLHLSQYPEALVQSHVLPWSRRIPFLGREWRRGFKKGGISLSVLPG